MAEARIHNSDYQSVEECRAAIVRYFSERSDYFIQKPKRAGNESPRRKRTGYQSGIKSDLYLGGHVVSPQTPLPRIYLTASG
jgi:hypothetical protein